MKKSLAKLTQAALDSIEYQMDGLMSGKLSVTDWQIGMAQDLITYHYAAYLAGAGLTRVDDISDGAKEAIGAVLKEQVDYLNGFADTLDDGIDDALEARYRARANLYAGALKTSYSIGATELLDVPAHPGQGSECMVNCGCRWRIVEVDAAEGDFDCYWERAKDDSCATCIDREERWNPYRIRGFEGQDD